MVKIRQHGPDNSLFDIVHFLPDIDSHFSVDSWQVCIDQCLGMGAVALEEATAGTWTLPDAEFRSAIAPIYQTIDGHFVGFSNGSPVVELLAVDSSWWELTSTPQFEAIMLAKYGAYQGSGT